MSKKPDKKEPQKNINLGSSIIKSPSNAIDIAFYNLMTYIKDRDLEQIKKAVIHNLNYFKEHNRLSYNNITKFYNEHKLWGTIDLDNDDLELVDRNAEALVKHRKDFEWLYNRLGDYRSKKILLNVLTYWLMMDLSKVSQMQDNIYSQYFDLDLIKCNKDEVFVDIGAYIGDTIVEYANVFGKDCYKKIYCYEIVPANIDYIKKNIDLFKLPNIIIRDKGISDEKGTLFLTDNSVSTITTISKLSEKGTIEVETTTIDDDIDEKVTFIKMDIEGAEEKALLGCLKKIKEYHPKLALSVYHNNDHLWKLARIIDETDPTYHFYLRYYGGPILPTEYILYAI